MKDYRTYLEKIGEYGVVTQIHHPLVMVEGLPSARPNEIVMFENGVLGEVFTIDENTVTILNFSKDPIQAGTQVTRTDKTLSVAVGKDFLGKAVNPLGEVLSSKYQKPKGTEERLIDTQPFGIADRSRIKKALRTGISIIDLLVPIGKGQRELVIGDRKTGKSSFLLDTLTKQVQEGSVAIYAAIGKKKNEIKQLEEYFQKHNLFNNVILVASSSYDSSTLIYLTPYTAMTIAEYFRDQGTDTLVILDDLSTHAKVYREISLLAKKFPGRDSYPGDIFHAHAKLLERAGNFKGEKGDTAITCLPVVETVEGDFTGYIPTNIMGMTDGHIYFDTNILYAGRRPAINSTLSVTRVGKQIHTPLERSINRELLVLLTLYEKTKNLSHFGTELSEQLKLVLQNGEKFYQFFDQPVGMLLPIEIQIILFAMIWEGLIDTKKLTEIRNALTQKLQQTETKHFFEQFTKVQSYNDLLLLVQKNKETLLHLCQ